MRLGATWLAPEIIQKFMTETFQIPYYLRHAVKVRYSPYTAEWRVEGKTATGRGDIISSETYGTSRANAYKILEETLNLKDVRIYDTIEDAEGKPKRVLNKRETMLAQQKQQVIKDAFANWVWQDPQRRIALVKQYNELFNSTRPREYDGSHIHFVGMNPEITLREHQRNAIAHVLYDDIRKKLVAAGVPENEIEFIHNADTEAKKAALFSKVRSGDVRVLLGSTAKMGAGTNVQSRLVAVHHLDVGWKPSDMTQRNGRIIRQGNMNKEVKVFNYVTEGTFDSYLFQTLENKQRFISQIMTSKSPVRSCDDVDEQALSYAEIKALCAGNPLIKEKMDLDVQVAKLKVLKADHQSQKFRLQDKLLTKFPADIQEANAHIAGLKADAQLAAAHPQVQEGFCGMTIKGVTYDEKKTAGERLVLACSELPNAEEKVIGNYRGFELSLRFDTYRSEYQALLKGQRKYTVPLGTDPLGNIIRLDNSLNNFPERITSAENELATLHQQQAAAQIEVEKPFPQEEELAVKSARLAELNAQLDVDEKSHEPEQDEEEQEDAPRRPSVLAALEEKSDKPEPVKPFKSYLDKDGDAR